MMFQSRNLKDTEALLNKYNIRYIFITQDMKEGLVWTDNNQGLLFLLKNGETFKKPYSSDKIEIWQYLKPRGTVSAE